MKAFKFRFQTVARIRKFELEEQAKALALALKAAEDKKKEIETNRQDFEREVQRVQELARRGHFDKQVIQLSLHYRERLRIEAYRMRRELEQLNLKVEKEQNLLIEKEKRKKTLDKLEERDKEKYDTRIKELETKEMDETASIRSHLSRISRHEQNH